jgi:phage shock protein E
MKRLLCLFAGLVLLGGCSQHNAASEAALGAGQEKPAATAKAINSQQARDLLTRQPAAMILDVRTGQEFSGGHLARAMNLDYNAADFQTRLLSLDKTKPYLVYCAVGGRSSKAAKLMQEMGFVQVYNVSGGYPELKSAGIPVAK